MCTLGGTLLLIGKVLLFCMRYVRRLILLIVLIFQNSENAWHCKPMVLRYLCMCRCGGTGRCTGLKSLRQQCRTGSTPVFGTKGFRVFSETYFYALAPKMAPELFFLFKTLLSLSALFTSISFKMCWYFLSIVAVECPVLSIASLSETPCFNIMVPLKCLISCNLICGRLFFSRNSLNAQLTLPGWYCSPSSLVNIFPIPRRNCLSNYLHYGICGVILKKQLRVGLLQMQNNNIAGWSSPVARRAHNPKVAGPNPAPATNEM